jgi:hypothetical protein|tara:strand:+ start:778 stop:984 length:207 start_codon:yes stop_codon:yes gene_type:complete
MTTQSKENNMSVAAKKTSPNIVKPQTERPNIDHLIKRILVERRKENKKNFLVFAIVLLTISGLILFTL